MSGLMCEGLPRTGLAIDDEMVDGMGWRLW